MIKQELIEYKVEELLTQERGLSAKLEVVKKTLQKEGYGTCVCCSRYPVKFANRGNRKGKDSYRICVECEKFCPNAFKCKFRDGNIE